MIVIRYGVDPDPKTVEVRMAALAKEGWTAEAFGITDDQLRHLIDPSRDRELWELIKQDPVRRKRLAKFLPENQAKAGGNGHAETKFEDIPKDEAEPEIDRDQFDEAIKRGRGRADDETTPPGNDKRGRAGGRPAPQVITRRASDITPEPISWLWKYWLARGKLHIIERRS